MKKRIIASALALTMAAGLAVSASAFVTSQTATIDTNIQLTAGTTTTNPATVSARFTAANVGASIASDADVWAAFQPAVTAGSTAAGAVGMHITEGTGTLRISDVFDLTAFAAGNFTYDAAATPASANVSIPVRTGLTAGNFNGTLAFENPVGTIMTIPLSGTVTAATTTTTALTTASGKIDDVREGTGVTLGLHGPGISVSGMGTTSDNGTGKRPANMNNLDIRPDAEIKVYLTAYDFQFETTGGSATQGVETQRVTTSQLRNGKITVKKSVAKGSNVIEEIKFDSDSTSAYILIDFVEYFVSTSEQDVDVTIYLAKSGSRRRSTDLDIAGTMANEEETVDAGDDYIDTSDGLVVEAEEYVRAIEMYLGNGVYAKLNMFKNKKYYGVALNTYDTTDATIMDQYREIDNVVHMRTVNVSGSGTVVYFDMDSSYYVYGADGTYLGLSSEQVPYSDKYYFATSRITINGETETELETEIGTEIDNINNVTGGENITTQNPNTGANGFVSVAVLAGVVSLAAAGMTVSRKNKK